MVTRKPTPQDRGLAPAALPPYPVTPVSTEQPPQFRMQDAQSALRPADDEPESPNAWSEEGKKAQHHGPPDVPESLRVGPPGYSQHNGSQDGLRSNPASTNPFMQRQTQGGLSDNKDSSAAAWGGFAERPAQPSGAPPPPPVPKGIYPQLQ